MFVNGALSRVAFVVAGYGRRKRARLLGGMRYWGSEGSAIAASCMKTGISKLQGYLHPPTTLQAGSYSLLQYYGKRV